MFLMKPKAVLQSHNFIESFDHISNIGRGFYSIYQIDISKEIDQFYFDTTMVNDDNLCLVEFVLTAYRDGPIDEEGKKCIRQAMDYFVEKNKKLIIRFCYDIKGEAVVSEPDYFSIIRDHMLTAGNILASYSKRILVVQGLFIGSWGEMHSGKYSDVEDIKMLYQAARTAFPEYIPLALRRPDYMRFFIDRRNYTMGNYRNLTLFNDAIFGSLTDMNTYAVEKVRYPAWIELNSREEEIKFLAPILDVAPYGGEVVGGDDFRDPVVIVDEFRKMHLTYLNRQHEQKILNRFRNMPMPEEFVPEKYEMNLFDYLQEFMGYRMVVRSASLDKKAKELSVVVENVGFADMYEPATCQLELSRERELLYVIDCPISPNKWKAGKKTILKFNVEDKIGWEMDLVIRVKFTNYDCDMEWANEFSDKHAVKLGRIASMR